VLFTGDDVTGLIDPGAARTDHVAADLTRLLGSLLADDRVRWGRALDWYQELRPLSDDELRLLRALDRSSVLLSGMTWVERFLNEEIPAARVPEISERLSAIARRVGNLGA
jgi:Ser/Thr protein kinase RdoA (MazF antagonist)